MLTNNKNVNTSFSHSIYWTHIYYHFLAHLALTCFNHFSTSRNDARAGYVEKALHSSISPVKKDCNPPGLHLSMGSPSPASPPPPLRSRAGEGGQPRRLPGEPLSSSSVFLVFAESLLSLRWTFYHSLETAIRGTVALMGF